MMIGMVSILILKWKIKLNKFSFLIGVYVCGVRVHACGHPWACTHVSAVLNSDVVESLRAVISPQNLEFTKEEKAKPLSFVLPQMATTMVQTGKI